MPRLPLFPHFFFFLSFFSSTTLATTVLPIDYGSDYITASLIKPGTPFDVLLDKDSKRKIRSSVAWKNGERLFGQDAFNLVRTILGVASTGRGWENATFLINQTGGSPLFTGDALPKRLV